MRPPRSHVHHASSATHRPQNRQPTFSNPELAALCPPWPGGVRGVGRSSLVGRWSSYTPTDPRGGLRSASPACTPTPLAPPTRPAALRLGPPAGRPPPRRHPPGHGPAVAARLAGQRRRRAVGLRPFEGAALGPPRQRPRRRRPVRPAPAGQSRLGEQIRRLLADPKAWTVARLYRRLGRSRRASSKQGRGWPGSLRGSQVARLVSARHPGAASARVPGRHPRPGQQPRPGRGAAAAGPAGLAWSRSPCLRSAACWSR
jgi:hypothetical protein